MNSRPDNLPDNQLVVELKQLRLDMDALKTRQTVSAASGVLGYQTSTNATWDYTGTVTSSTSNIWDIYFIGDGSQAYPVMNPYCDFFITTPTDPNRLPLYPLTWSDGTSVVSGFNYLVTEAVPSPTSQLQWEWGIGLATNLGCNVTVYLKAYVVGSCPGTLTVTRRP